MAAGLFPQAFTGDPATLGTANTNADFSAGTIVTVAAGVAGGKPVPVAYVVVYGTIAADTEVDFARDNGSIKVPIGTVPIPAFTPGAQRRYMIIPVVFPNGVANLPTTSDLLLAIVRTSDAMKVFGPGLKFQ
jgi:hypothetical protein